MRKQNGFLLIIFVALCIGGCSSSGSKPRWYTLHPQGFEASDVLSGNLKSPLGVGPIVLPESLSRSELVAYDQGNQVIVDSTHLWAGDLKRAISRVMASNLSDLSSMVDIWAYPWDVRIRPEDQLSLAIEQLGGPVSGPVKLKAQWKLLSDYGQKLEKTGRCEHKSTLSSSSYQDYVFAINSLIGECSKEIFEALTNP